VAVRVRSDRWYEVPAGRDEVWDAFARPGRFREWWPWLVAFDGRDLAEGRRWDCTVAPPLPYRVRFTLHLTLVEAPHAVEAAVDGDVVGAARLELTDAGAGSRIHLVSDLAPGNAALRAFATLARPVVRRGHDWVLDTGARQFVDRAVGPSGDS
jgi:uncharacterized protein YndB with AHSA1/START domain